MNYKRGVRLFSSKKGMDIDLWFNTFELVVVFVAGAVLLQTINADADSTTYEKIYLSRDNAFLLDTIYSSPGDINYYYTEESGRFIFDFKQNEVQVYEDYELREGGAIGYPFAEDKNMQFLYKTVNPNKIFPWLVYSKTGDILKVDRPQEFTGFAGGKSGGAGSGAKY